MTGENLGQVASQTMEAHAGQRGRDGSCRCCARSSAWTRRRSYAIARHIGTFDTSILPYEDCCTVFTPRHPKTKPHVEEVREIESVLDIEGLVSRAMAQREVVKVKL